MTDVENLPSPYLTGPWEPIATESTIAGLVVTGDLPDALQGTYIRNGPNPAFDPIGRYHLFDGDGMVHGVELRDGSAAYRNRYVRAGGFPPVHPVGEAGRAQEVGPWVVQVITRRQRGPEARGRRPGLP